MMCSCFSIYLFLLITIKNIYGSWLPESTDKNDRYTEDVSLEELERIDPNLYREVIESRPRLIEVRKRRRHTVDDDLVEDGMKQPTRIANFNWNRSLLDNLRSKDPELDLRELEEEERQAIDAIPDYEVHDWDHNMTTYNSTHLSRRDNGVNTWFFYSHVMWDYYYHQSPNYVGSFVQSCYECGYKEGIPRSPLCHDAFESPDWRARTAARYFRTKCYKNSYNDMSSYSRKKPFLTDEKIFQNDRGLKSRKYGLKMGGCYKRFLDVGKVYTQRGCRRWPPGPWYDNENSTWNFATHRFRKLEHALGQAKEDRCLFSPHASLTPFHRGISLFARYHVCVCYTDYCNGGPASLKGIGLKGIPRSSLAGFAIYIMNNYIN